MFLMTRFRRSNRLEDAGAVAVLVAILAVVLFGMAALAVEVTDVYTRDRATQTVADLSAYAGAQDLPNACTALATAYDNLDTNQAEDIRDDENRLITLNGLNDGGLENGEIQIYSSFPPAEAPPAPLPTVRGTGGWLDTGGCPAAVPSAGNFVRVVTPPATRAYAFGQVFQDGPESVTVQNTATVGIASPTGFGKERIMPVFIPGGCGLGTKQVAAGPRPYPVTLTPATEKSQPLEVEILAADGTVLSTSLNPSLSNAFYGEPEISDTGLLKVDVRVPDLRANPAVAPVTFDLHYNVGLGTVRVTPTTPNGITSIVQTSVSATTKPARWTAKYTLTLDTAVTDRPGEWQLRAGMSNPATAAPKFGNVAYFTIEGAIVDSGLCGDVVSGDFGTLRVARKLESGNVLDLNIARGLDHSLTAFSPGTLPSPLPALATECLEDYVDSANPGIPAGALRDLTPSGPVDGANCVYIESGLSGGAGIMTNGLITGPTSGGPGRLEVTGITPPSINPECSNPAAGGGSTWQWKTPVPGDHKILNTVLSCYLAPERTLANVLAGDEDSLSKEIFKDPRFFFVPILNGVNRPGSGSSYFAIKEFHAAFITSEGIEPNGTYVAPASCSGSAQTCNGIQFGNTRGGGKQVFSLTTFVFPTSALPTEVDQGDNGGTFIGGTKDFVMVE